MRFIVTITMPEEMPVRQEVEFRSERGVEKFVELQMQRLGPLGGDVTWWRVGEGRGE